MPSINFSAVKKLGSLTTLARSYGIELVKNGSALQGLCPFHSEDTPSWTVYADQNRYHCMGCAADGDCIDLVRHMEGGITEPAAVKIISDICGLEHDAVYDKGTSYGRSKVSQMPKRDEKPVAPKPVAKPQEPKVEYSDRRFICAYHYQNADGSLAYENRRFHQDAITPGVNKYKKHFYPRWKHTDGAWVNGMTEGKYAFRAGAWQKFDPSKDADGKVAELVPPALVLYNLPRVLAAHTVIKVEGEKDADNINDLFPEDSGIAGTSIMGGSNKEWLPQYSEALQGKSLIQFRDNDAAGDKFGDRCAAEFKAIDPSFADVRMPKGFKDISEVIEPMREAGQSIREMRDVVLGMIESTKADAIRDQKEAEAKRKGLIGISDIIEIFPNGLQAFIDTSKRPPGIKSGLKKFDEMTGGFRPGELIIIAARPAMGKTALAVNIANAITSNASNPKAVAIFSLEMDRASILQRLVCTIAEVDQHVFRSGQCTPDQHMALMGAVADLADRNLLFIDDFAAASVSYIEEKVKQLEAENDTEVGLVIVDYLQLATPENTKAPREQQISGMSRGFKLLAKSLKIPFLVLSQLSRACEVRPGDHRPILSDLRESGSIEQDADLIGFIYREEVYKPEKEAIRGIGEIIIGKQRNGPTGRIKLRYVPHLTQFKDLTAFEEAQLPEDREDAA